MRAGEACEACEACESCEPWLRVIGVNMASHASQHVSHSY